MTGPSEQAHPSSANKPDQGLSGALVAIAVFFLALIPRLHAIWSGFLTLDEMIQVFDAARFARTLAACRRDAFPPM